MTQMNKGERTPSTVLEKGDEKSGDRMPLTCILPHGKKKNEKKKKEEWYKLFPNTKKKDIHTTKKENERERTKKK